MRSFATHALLTLAAFVPAASQSAEAESTASVTVASPLGASSAAFEVLGLVRSAAPGRSVAILRQGDRTRVVAEGETAFGARLLSIGRESIRLELASGPQELPLARPSASPVVPADSRREAPPAADLPPEDPATPARDMDRRQLQLRLGEEMNRILSETAIVPVIEDGRVAGVRVTRIADGSLLTDAGLRTGDVLVRINDTQIDGMATLIGLWPRLQGASDLRAVVLRGGQPISLRVTLR